MLLTGLSMSSSILSGISIQQAINKKPIPSAQDRVVGVSRWLIQSTKPPARPWLTKVAKNIALIMVHGRRQRAAKTSASNGVLSPISASDTMPVETRKAFIVNLEFSCPLIKHHLCEFVMHVRGCYVF